MKYFFDELLNGAQLNSFSMIDDLINNKQDVETLKKHFVSIGAIFIKKNGNEIFFDISKDMDISLQRIFKTAFQKISIILKVKKI